MYQYRLVHLYEEGQTSHWPKEKGQATIYGGELRWHIEALSE